MIVSRIAGLHDIDYRSQRKSIGQRVRVRGTSYSSGTDDVNKVEDLRASSGSSQSRDDKSVAFVQSKYDAMLAVLHQEIEHMKTTNRELVYKLTMKDKVCDRQQQQQQQQIHQQERFTAKHDDKGVQVSLSTDRPDGAAVDFVSGRANAGQSSLILHMLQTELVDSKRELLKERQKNRQISNQMQLLKQQISDDCDNMSTDSTLERQLLTAQTEAAHLTRECRRYRRQIEKMNERAHLRHTSKSDKQTDTQTDSGRPWCPSTRADNSHALVLPLLSKGGKKPTMRHSDGSHGRPTSSNRRKSSSHNKLPSLTPTPNSPHIN